jgi:hypothetical protein
VAAFLNVTHAAESEGSYTSPVCIAIVALAFGLRTVTPPASSSNYRPMLG